MSKGLGEWLSAESKRVEEELKAKHPADFPAENSVVEQPRPRVIRLTFQDVIDGRAIARYTDSETAADIECEVKSDSHWERMIEKAKRNARVAGCICQLYNFRRDGEWTPAIFNYSK